MDDPSPTFSVIIPMERHMGHAIDAVASWTRQRYPADRVEILVMTDGADPALETAVRQQLRPGDRLLRHASRDERAQYDAGARQARGELLIFTESHCVAEPDFLDEMARFLGADHLVGACCRTFGDHTNAVSRVVRQDFKNDFELWTRPDDRRKVIIHGFTIRRDTYLAVGGYEPPFGNFMDAVLAAKLDARGHRLGFAQRARVRHHYSTGLSDTLQQFASYAVGECSYRLRNDKDHCDRHFGLMPEWNEVLHARGSDYRRIVDVLVRQSGRAVWSLDVPLLYATICGLWGLHNGPTWFAAWSLRRAWLHCHLLRWHPARMMQAFRDMCRAAVRLHRLRFLNDHGDALAAHTDVYRGLTEGRWSMRDIPSGALIGWHDAETLDDRVFRWSAPIAALRLSLPPGRWRVVLDTGAMHRKHLLGLRVIFNDARLRIHHDRAGLTMTLESEHLGASADQLLILTCNPLRAARPDIRRLGLPVFNLQIINA